MSSQLQRDIAQLRAELAEVQKTLADVMMQLAALGHKRPPGRPPKPK